MLGGRKLFQPTFTFETYFNESVAGLEVGAPVRFRGVPLGRVSEILTSRSTYERGVPLDKRRGYIVVRAKVDLSADEAEEMDGDEVQLVKRGLRAQPQLEGVTGQQYLAVDFLDPAKYPPLEFDWTPKYAYLPSAPSLSGVIIANAQTFLASLNAANVRALSQNLSTLVVDLDKKLNEVPVSELSADAHDVLARIDAVLADPALEKTLHDVAAISGHVRKLADDGNLDRMVERIDGQTDPPADDVRCGSAAGRRRSLRGATAGDTAHRQRARRGRVRGQRARLPRGRGALRL